jgi:hypothetical protein
VNAIPKLQPIPVVPLQKPTYGRWDLVRTNDPAAWVRANRELLQGWYNDLARYTDERELDPFDGFCLAQFDVERAHFEELRTDARLDHDYVDREDA